MGAPVALETALEVRKTWIETTFTPLVIFLGKLAAPLALLRLILRRRDEEAYSLAFLAGATVQYVVFPQGADIHIFWPQHFGGYFALAFAQLVATLGDVGRFAGKWFDSARATHVLHWVPLAAVLLFAMLIVPDSLRTLRYARETGGRFNENGNPLRSETNLVYVLDRLRARLPPFTGPDVLSPELLWLWNYAWTSDGEGRTVNALPTGHVPASDPHPIFVARAISLTESLGAKFGSASRSGMVWRAGPSELSTLSAPER